MGEREGWNGMTPFYKVSRGQPFNHINDKRGNKTEDQKGVGKPAKERLAKKLFMKDDIDNQDFNIPARSCPEASPAPTQKDDELFPGRNIPNPFDLSLEIEAYSKPHPPDKKNEGRDEHEIKNKMFTHVQVSLRIF
jgi:hypothetical protein